MVSIDDVINVVTSLFMEILSGVQSLISCISPHASHEFEAWTLWIW